MLINCVAYQDGRKLADIPVADIDQWLGRPDCFVWVALLGGLYAKRDNSHVAFAMVYDAAKPRTQVWMRIAGNILLLVAFAAALVPSWGYVSFMGYKHSDALKIPMTLAYFPFIVFLVDIIVRLAIDIAKDSSILRKGAKP